MGSGRQRVTLFLGGDLMTGRGIDQILAHPSSPELDEEYVRDARDYVRLAERRNGPIERAVAPSHPWGDALAALDRARPDVRIVNLETAITTSDDAWPDKAVRYRMHPANVGCLTAARLDVCTLANNHALDFGRAGLADTLEALACAGIRTAGAGIDLAHAVRPALVDVPGGGRVVVIGVGCEDSGIPWSWRAADDRPGLDVLDALDERSARALAARFDAIARPGDLRVASIHWGSNWGAHVPDAHVRFAHALIEHGVHVVHGHSSHHPRAIEIHRGGLVLYGCGELVDDYEGISGHERYRPDLVLAYLPTLDARTGELLELRMLPFRLERFRLVVPSDDDVELLWRATDDASAPLGTRVVLSRGELTAHRAPVPHTVVRP